MKNDPVEEVDPSPEELNPRTVEARRAMEPSEDLTQAWSNIQAGIAKMVSQSDCPALAEKLLRTSDPDVGDSLYVAGADVSFFPGDPKKACLAYLVLQVKAEEAQGSIKRTPPHLPAFPIVYEDVRVVDMAEPYIPGFLAFREAQPILEAIQRQRLSDAAEDRKCFPDVLIVDGNGLLHRRSCGLACHVGVQADLPSIGVAKNWDLSSSLDVTGSGQGPEGPRPAELLEPDKSSGSRKRSELAARIKGKQVGEAIDIFSSGTGGDLGPDEVMVVGKALKTSASAARPVYVSVGHKVSLDTAVKIVLACSKHKLPEPTRLADIKSREFIRQFVPDQMEAGSDGLDE